MINFSVKLSKHYPLKGNKISKQQQKLANWLNMSFPQTQKHVNL